MTYLFVLRPGIPSPGLLLPTPWPWFALACGLWTIGIGLLFTFHFSLPLLFILLGISVMLGQSRREPRQREKAKNDDLHEQDTDDGQEREEPYHYELGDDGEMVNPANYV
jgi:hypothetical protein